MYKVSYMKKMPQYTSIMKHIVLYSEYYIFKT